MPYISRENRKELENLTNEIEKTKIQNPGDLNYLITMLCKKYFLQEKESYTTHNSIIGVLESSKIEWYRQRTSKYEDKKISENGDV
ncbi:MAG: hypothetical protein WCG45_05985 [bacterium]